MKLDIRSFVSAPGRRFPLDFVMSPEDGAAAEDASRILEIHVVGEAFAQLSTLYMEVDLHARIVQPCRRCLVPVEREILVSEPFELPITPEADWVDPYPTAHQLIETAREPHVVCRPDCRGLCPRCGANLNEEPEHVCSEEENADRRTLRDYLS